MVASTPAVHIEPYGDPLEDESARRPLVVWFGIAATILLCLGVGWWLLRPTERPIDRSPSSELATVVVTPRPQVVDPPKAPAAPAPPAPEEGPVVVGDATPVVSDEPEAQAPTRRRRRRRRRRQANTPEPVAPAPAPTRKTSRPKPKPKPPSAADLLRDAESALRRGKAADAYRLAARSDKARSTASAAGTMARAACRMGKSDQAKRALKRVPLRDRGAIRRDCRQNGTRIGL